MQFLPLSTPAEFFRLRHVESDGAYWTVAHTDVFAPDRREIAADNVSNSSGVNRKPQQPTTVPPLSD